MQNQQNFAYTLFYTEVFYFCYILWENIFFMWVRLKISLSIIDVIV